MKMIPTRTFLLRQSEGTDGKLKDVIARKGEAIEVTKKEAEEHQNSLQPLPEATSKKK